MTRGAVYIVHGEKAVKAAEKSIDYFMQNNPYPVAVIGDFIEMTQQIYFDDVNSKGRFTKVNLFDLSPFDQTLYLDADTVPHADLTAGFDILDDGFDVVIMPSSQQGNDCLWHVEEEERKYTFDLVGNNPLQLQAGLFYFRKNKRTKQLFHYWKMEWYQFVGQDQGALLRALSYSPVKIWLLGYPWNGGAMVAHNFGDCR